MNLWSLIPRTTRWALLPLASSAFLVEAGTQTAQLLVFAFTGTWPADDSVRSVQDVTACLLAVNLALFVLVLYIRLQDQADGRATEHPSELLIDFFAVVLTVSKLIALSVDYGRAEIGIYAIYAVTYLVIVPFFGRRFDLSPQATHRPGERLRQPLAEAFRHLGAAVTFSVTALFIGAAWFVLLNNVLALPSHNAGRAEFWGVNPAALSVGVLQIALIAGGDAPGRQMRSVGRPGVALYFTVALLMNIAVVQVAIDPGALLLRHTSASLRGEIAVLALGYSAFFYSAFYLARWHRSPSTTRTALTFATCFGSFGVLAGGLVCSMRLWLDAFTVTQLNLLWMQAVGFALVGAWLPLADDLRSRHWPAAESLLEVGEIDAIEGDAGRSPRNPTQRAP